jgi:hypothetical protein
MTRLTTSIALALAVAAALTACQDTASSPEPVMAPTVARSVGGAARITDETQLAELRQVTARFHSIDAAKQAGYSTQITPCWAHHSAGGMGYISATRTCSTRPSIS